MKRFPDGISGGQIREELEKEGLEPGDQTHLDRRKRDLPKWFVITKQIATSLVNGKNRRVTLYKFSGTEVRSLTRGKSIGRYGPKSFMALAGAARKMI